MTVVLTVVILFAMTSAWYTNIVQTSGLVFEAESWGFEGEIKVENTAITAAPGDDGIVHLEVQNTGEGVSAISLNVSKGGMLEEMQQRLFFYVDTHMSRNDEIMDRVYLSSTEGYTYTLFNQGKLMLTEQTSNAPQLRWHWVYDVLGYYVLAQAGPEVTALDGTTVQTMDIKEYLRPIEYDYDKATKTVHTAEDGTVTVTVDTVDGKLSPEGYLVNLSLKDGYKGNIIPTQKLKNNFYPVDVDENGYGIYAYLCSYSEIEWDTQYDTDLGKIAYKNANGEELTEEETRKLNHTATLTISAQKNETTAVNVSTLSTLERIIAQNTADVVQLSSNITIPKDKSLTIPKDARIMLDLNDYTLTSKSETAIKAQPGSSLTLLNGMVQYSTDLAVDETSYGVYTTGAEVVMSEVKINGFDHGVYLADNQGSNEIDSRVHMVGCEIDAEICAVFASGNGILSDQKTQVIIENCKLSSDSIVISGNGDTSGNGRWGTDIQIIDSEIIGNTGDGTVKAAGIYHPQKDSTLTVYHSTVTGYNGIAIKGGFVRIDEESVITGVGDTPVEPAFGGSGFTDTADAVYIETNYGYEIVLEIGGDSKLVSDRGLSLQVYESTATNVAVKIESGTFDIDVSAYLAEGSTQTIPGDGKYVVTASASAIE